MAERTVARRSDGRATIRDVAARAGVSVATVSRVLNGTYRPPPATHERVMRAVRELAMINVMRERGAEAVVLVGGLAESPDHVARLATVARSLRRSGSRLLLCGRPWPDDSEPVLAVECDNDNGAFAATGHVLSAGRCRIAHVAGPSSHGVAGQRLAGRYAPGRGTQCRALDSR